jgi:hypothetical protein
MKTTTTLWLLLVVLLAGCSSPSEKQALYEISEFYGGSVRLSAGRNFSTSSDEPKGHYLAVALNNPSLSRHFEDLRLPASNCAYLAFSNLKPTEREDYDFVKVALRDSASTHSYSFSQSDLKQALAAGENLRTLIFNIQGSDYVAAANNFNPDALGTMPRDSLPSVMYRLGTRLNPFTEYRIHGFALVREPARGEPLPLVRLFVSVPRPPAPDHHLMVIINPAMSDAEHFLYGLNMLD